MKEFCICSLRFTIVGRFSWENYTNHLAKPCCEGPCWVCVPELSHWDEFGMELATVHISCVSYATG